METTDTEDAASSRRQQTLRRQLDEAFDIITDFLASSSQCRCRRPNATCCRS